jgi:hypothetical protein
VGETITRAVEQLSHHDGQSDRDYFGGMGALAFAVKCADRLANVRRNGTGPVCDWPRQRARLLPKYQRQLPEMRRRAHELGPPFIACVAQIEAELKRAALRLAG